MITGPKFSDAQQGVLHTANGETCFLCSKPTKDPAIMWHGVTGEIFLHFGCTADFLLRLGRDLHEAQHRLGFRFKDVTLENTNDPR